MKILVTAHALVGGAAMLGACGQKSALFLPNTPESAGRATLTETLKIRPGQSAPANPRVPPSPASPTPVAGPSPANAPLGPTSAPTSAPQLTPP